MTPIRLRFLQVLAATVFLMVEPKGALALAFAGACIWLLYLVICMVNEVLDNRRDRREAPR